MFNDGILWLNIFNIQSVKLIDNYHKGHLFLQIVPHVGRLMRVMFGN